MEALTKKKIVERKLNRSNASSKHSVNSKQNDKQPKKEENKKTAEPDSPTRTVDFQITLLICF
mgnify:FL=1